MSNSVYQVVCSFKGELVQVWSGDKPAEAWFFYLLTAGVIIKMGTEKDKVWLDYHQQFEVSKN